MSEQLKIFKALGEETKNLIIRALKDKERCACEIPDLIGRTQSNTSMQLAKLLDAGILEQKRDGKSIIYSIKDERVIELLKIMDGGE